MSNVTKPIVFVVVLIVVAAIVYKYRAQIVGKFQSVTGA